MEADVIIDKIKKANRLEQVLDPTNLKIEYFKIAKLIHPDVCKTNPDAGEAMRKLNELKEQYEKGYSGTDEAGKFQMSPGSKIATYDIDQDSHKTSQWNWAALMAFPDEASNNFKRYMPLNMEVGKSMGQMKVSFCERVIPMTNLKLPQIHVNWILSRMLEFVAWLDGQRSYVHCGINPESVFICPENHGIQIATYYFMTKDGAKMTNISGRYQHWYPQSVFDTKIADPSIDLEMCMRTAIYLLGDQSGSGVKLRKDPSINQEMLDFMIAQHSDPVETWRQYRELLDKNFKKEFHPLNM
jgi:hypothetical protein